jgi:putative oxidoreductase
VRRLFWTFPDGWPGTGLLLMRVATSCALLYGAGTEWPGQFPSVPAVLSLVRSFSAICLLAGIGTPVWGVTTAASQLWQAYVDGADVLAHCLLATLGASLALLGGGAWSIDAWIFGWRRIDVGGLPREVDGGAPREQTARLERFDRPPE